MMDIDTYSLYDDTYTAIVGIESHPYDAAKEYGGHSYYIYDPSLTQYNIGWHDFELPACDLGTGVTSIGEYMDGSIRLVDTVGNLAALIGELSVYNIRVKYVSVLQLITVSIGDAAGSADHADCPFHFSGNPDAGADTSISVYGRTHTLHTVTIPIDMEEGDPWDQATFGDIESIYIGWNNGYPDGFTSGALIVTSIELNVGSSSGTFWVNISGMQESV